MGGHKIVNQDGMHFLTFTVVGWVDVFTRQIYRDIIINSLIYCIEQKELRLFAYVIMSNHIHLIAKTDAENGLSAIIRDFKKYTAKQIIKAIQINRQESRKEWILRLFKYYAKYNKNNTTYQFWKQDNRPIELISAKWIQQKLDYIHNNPVVTGTVIYPEEYLYSSAKNYASKEYILEVEILNPHTMLGFQ